MKPNAEVTINPIEHIRVRTQKPFSDVVGGIEAMTGVFDSARISEHLAAGAPPSVVIEAIESMAGESGFMRFDAWDHGAVLRQTGLQADAIRFAIGHPLIAARMTRHAIGSALYAPLSLLVAGDGRGGAMLEYDRPSTLFKQFNDDSVTEVALELDEKLAALIHAVADSK